MSRSSVTARLDAQMEEAARRNGYDSLASALKQTAYMDKKEAAEEIGVPLAMISRARRRAGISSTKSTRQALRVLGSLEGEGWTDDLIIRTAHLSQATLDSIRTVKSAQVSGSTFYRLLSLTYQDPRNPKPLVPPRSTASSGDAAREEKANAAGYKSWEGAIRDTARHPAKEVAGMLGVSDSTVTKYRRQFGVSTQQVKVNRKRYEPITWTCKEDGEVVTDLREHEEQFHSGE